MRTLFTIMITCLISFGVSAQSNQRIKMPMLGETAPSFTAQSTNGTINFPEDYFGKWKILLSHPASFTPVCTSEILELAYLQDEFEKKNTALVVLSTDGINSHIQWVKSMEEINYRDMGPVDIKFPVVSDASYTISQNYGMIHPSSSKTQDIRAVFIIDPEDKVRLIIYYPMNIGRNIDEIMRSLEALQTVDKKDVLTPANWELGDNLLLKSPETIKEAEKLQAKNNSTLTSVAWYMWFITE